MGQQGSGSQGAMGQQGSGSQGSTTASIDKADSTFITKAAESSLFTHKLGQLAQEKSQSDDVKQLGQQLVDSHDKSIGQLGTIAQQKGVTIPTDVSKADQQKLDQLSKLSGNSFDKAFLAYVQMENKRDVTSLQSRSSQAKDEDVKSYAANMLTQQQQLEQSVKDVQTKIAHPKSSTGVQEQQHGMGQQGGSKQGGSQQGGSQSGSQGGVHGGSQQGGSQQGGSQPQQGGSQQGGSQPQQGGSWQGGQGDQ